MKLKRWSWCLGILCALVAVRAEAAKFSFSDKGFIDVGSLIQAQYRIEQDAAPSGHDPSNDFLLRRARIILSGQFDEHIGFFFDTDISYGTVSTAVSAAANTPAGGSAQGWNNNIYVLDALAIYKVSRSLIIDAGLTLLPYSHNSLTNPATLIGINSTFGGTAGPYWAPNNQRGFRDVGVVIRGLLLDDRLYYRLGVFNGVNGTKNTAAAGAVSNGLNPGDAPNYAGMLRFNIAGKEEGYGFCQMCFASSPIISIGVAADVQPNSFRGVAPTGPTTAGVPTGMITWTNYNADIFADIPFGGDVELSADLLGQIVKAGDNTPQSGYSFNGIIGLRFGVIQPYAQLEYFNSGTQYVGYTKVGAGATTAFTAGDVTTYRFGISWYLHKHNYKVTAEVAFQNKENAGVETSVGTPATVIGTVPPNHWVGTLQFQAYF